MVHDVVREEAETVERARRVKVHRHACPAVLILADTFDSGSLVEVAGADTFPFKSQQRQLLSLLRPDQSTYRITSQSVPHATMSSFCDFIMSVSCSRTSRALRSSLACRKCLIAHWSLNLQSFVFCASVHLAGTQDVTSATCPFAFHWVYVFNNVR